MDSPQTVLFVPLFTLGLTALTDSPFFPSLLFHRLAYHLVTAILVPSYSEGLLLLPHMCRAPVLSYSCPKSLIPFSLVLCLVSLS